MKISKLQFTLILALVGIIAGTASSNPGCTLQSVLLKECMLSQKQNNFDFSKRDSSGLEGDYNILLFGETHVCESHRAELTARMTEFKAAGITHFALEAYPFTAQEKLSAYKLGNNTLREELKAMQELSPGQRESYAVLMDAALEQDITLIAMDLPYKSPDLDRPDWKLQESIVNAERENQWTKTVYEIISSTPKAKVLMMVGELHISQKNKSAPMRIQTRLKEAGLKPITISIDGGEMYFDAALTKAARAAGIQAEKFLLKMDTRDPAVSGDYQLHLPQIQLPSHIN